MTTTNTRTTTMRTTMGAWRGRDGLRAERVAGLTYRAGRAAWALRGRLRAAGVGAEAVVLRWRYRAVRARWNRLILARDGWCEV